MKKAVTINALILLFLGMGITFIAILSVGFNFSALSVNAERTEKVFETEYAEGQNFKIISTIDNIKISPSEDGQIHIVCYESEYTTYELTNEAEEITLTRHEERRNWWEYISFNFDFRDYATQIQLPLDFNGAITVESTTSNVEISDFQMIEELKVKVTTGNIQCEDLAAESVQIISTTGNIKAENVAAETISVAATTGNIVLKSTEAAEIGVTVTTGNVKLYTPSAEKLNVITTTGNITLEEADAVEFYLKATTGDIRGTVQGSQSKYTLRQKTRTGNCNFNDRDGNGDRYLTAETTTGNINIAFSD